MSLGRRRLGLAFLLTAAFITALCLPSMAPVGSSAATQAQRSQRCEVPKLTGLTLFWARKRAARAGCKLRLTGATVENAIIQTVAKQSPHPGSHRRSVTLWINPLCVGSAFLGPPEGEPFLTPGPSELVSGLYLAGGPITRTSEPKCPTSGTPEAGTITVSDPATGATVAMQTVARGQLATIPLPPGNYTIVGALVGQHPQVGPVQVTIPTGETVRQDLFWGGIK